MSTRAVSVVAGSTDAARPGARVRNKRRRLEFLCSNGATASDGDACCKLQCRRESDNVSGPFDDDVKVQKRGTGSECSKSETRDK